jgi:catechol 2,3-dioxygenase
MEEQTILGKLPDDISIGAVHILVADVERSLGVWRDLMGLNVLSREYGMLSLGAGESAMIVLHEGATMPAPDRALGLFHVAVHVPERVDFARIAIRLVTSGHRHSGQDHMFSESLYFADPDGNGIEIAFDTPEHGRLEIIDGNPVGVTNDGKNHSMLEPLDLGAVRAEMPAGVMAEGSIAAKSFIGHIHFRTNGLDRVNDFYRDVLGFRPNINSASFKFCDLGTESRNHRIAFNMWGGEGLPERPQGAAGVMQYTIEVPTVAVLDGVRTRLKAAGVNLVEDAQADVGCADPEGNNIRIAVAV